MTVGASNTANFYVLTNNATNTITWYDNKQVWQENTVVVKTCICASWRWNIYNHYCI